MNAEEKDHHGHHDHHDHDDHHHYDLDERFEISSGFKKTVGIILGVGLLLLIVGLIVHFSTFGHHDDHHHSQLNTELLMADADGDGGHHAVHADHHGPSVWTRIFTNIWHNNVFFLGLGIIGVFFVAFQYAAMAGWSAAIKRIPEAIGTYVPIGGVLLIGSFFLVNHDIFHWTHADLYKAGTDTFDSIINGKKGYFFMPGSDEAGGFPIFYFTRMVVFIGLWIVFFSIIRKLSLKEDQAALGTQKYYRKLIRVSAGFLVFFAVSSSMSAWDWVMSIDTHWFSTMFGWYVFASWFVAGLATITLTVVFLKEAGYLKMVNENHLHDLGKFVFAFSIFWTYIWFSQFLLIYYANISEETIYFVERLKNGEYQLLFFVNIFVNFFFPFMALMTRDAKRKMIMLKVVCCAVIVGHWIDFYLMITPGVLKDLGGVGLLEIGLALVYISLFAVIVAIGLKKAPLVAKNHPMIQESIHHHI